MLTTPLGARYPQEMEDQMLLFGTRRLSHYISAYLRSQERKIIHEGIVLRPVREDSAFHGLAPQGQLVVLHNCLTTFFDQFNQSPMTQFWNSALECVYSCILHEIKAEIEGVKSGAPARTLRSNSARYLAYYAYESFMHKEKKKCHPSSTEMQEWVAVVDDLAGKTVFDREYAKRFEVGYLGNLTDMMVQSAEAYFDSLG